MRAKPHEHEEEDRARRRGRKGRKGKETRQFSLDSSRLDFGSQKRQKRDSQPCPDSPFAWRSSSSRQEVDRALRRAAKPRNQTISSVRCPLSSSSPLPSSSASLSTQQLNLAKSTHNRKHSISISSILDRFVNHVVLGCRFLLSSVLKVVHSVGLANGGTSHRASVRCFWVNETSKEDREEERKKRRRSRTDLIPQIDRTQPSIEQHLRGEQLER